MLQVRITSRTTAKQLLSQSTVMTALTPEAQLLNHVDQHVDQFAKGI